MSTFVVEGGHRMCGEIVPQGAKNEALEILCATLLTGDDPTESKKRSSGSFTHQ